MKYYVTDDTALAAYLYLRGETIIEGTVENPAHHRRRCFLFEPSDNIETLKREFYDRTSLVVPLDYQEARTHISRFLKQDLMYPVKSVK